MSKWGGGPKCGKCGKSVYQAEEVLGAGKKWHKMCFKCEDCNKLLDSSIVAEHEGCVYCKPCHVKHFGPTGYGYGGGAGALSMEGGSKQPQKTWSGGSGESTGGGFGGGDRCPRCGRAVYMAEKIIGAGESWHKACFTCAICGKSLDSSTSTDREGEVFCKACYGKEFGPKGVGFGQGAGSLSHAN